MRYALSTSALLLAGLVPASIVVAAEYLTVDEAQKAVFPEADAFQQIAVAPTAAQLQALLAQAGPQPPHGTIRIWNATPLSPEQAADLDLDMKALV